MSLQKKRWWPARGPMACRRIRSPGQKNAHRCSAVKKAPCPAAAMPAPEERRYSGVFWHAGPTHLKHPKHLKHIKKSGHEKEIKKIAHEKEIKKIEHDNDSRKYPTSR